MSLSVLEREDILMWVRVNSFYHYLVDNEVECGSLHHSARWYDAPTPRANREISRERLSKKPPHRLRCKKCLKMLEVRGRDISLTEEQKKLVADNQLLAYDIIHKLWRCDSLVSELADDAVGEAFVALCKAAKGFDPSRNLKFSTYAHSIITRQVFKAANDWHRRGYHPTGTVPRRYRALKQDMGE